MAVILKGEELERELIGREYDHEEQDFGDDLICAFNYSEDPDNEVRFGSEETIPFHEDSERKFEVYDNNFSFLVEIVIVKADDTGRIIIVTGISEQ